MKKLSTEKADMIIGGASTSGAALNGIASIIGKFTDFIIDIAALPLVYIESSKNHDKAKFKLGNTSVEIDNSISAKNQVVADNANLMNRMENFSSPVESLSYENVNELQMIEHESQQTIDLDTPIEDISYFG